MPNLQEHIKYIGLFNDSFPPVLDGVTNTVGNYAFWFHKWNLNPLVVTPKNPVDLEFDYPVLRYFSLPIRSRRPYRYGYPLADLEIWRKLRSRQFRILHAHSPFSSGRLAVYVKKRQNLPLIGTFHSKYRDDLQHSFRHTPWIVDIIMRRILKFFSVCDEVWIPQAEVEETVREYGFKGELEVVENGIEFADVPVADAKRLGSSYRERNGIPPNRFMLLFVGQQILEKGVDKIIRSLSFLPEGLDWEMNFVGTGYYLQEMKRMVRESGLSGHVRFHGAICDREVLKEIYAASDLFLFPSLYDNAPIVVREAAAMLTPSVLAENSTASYAVRDGVNGFVVSTEPSEIAACVCRLAQDRVLLGASALMARDMMVRSWKDVAGEVLDRYNSLIDRYDK